MITIFLISLLTACESSLSQFDRELLKGTWLESDYQFINDDCELSSVLTANTVHSYTFESTFTTEDNSDYNNILVNDLPSMSDFLRKCYFSGYDSPEFSCSFPWFMFHYDSWKTEWYNHSLSEIQGCTIEVYADQEGLFLDEQTLFLAGQIGVSCDSSDEASDTSSINCDSSFSSTVRKQ